MGHVFRHGVDVNSMNTLHSLPLTARRALLAAFVVLAGLPATATAQNVVSERLWLPASAANLRPFLVMAVNKVMEDPTCVEVLYARLNEYRTIYEEPTFTILCQKDPKTTFNRVVKITEVDPDYFAKLQAGSEAATQAQRLNPEIEALRQQLLAPAAATGTAPAAAPEAAPVEEVPANTSLDLQPAPTP